MTTAGEAGEGLQGHSRLLRAGVLRSGAPHTVPLLAYGDAAGRLCPGGGGVSTDRDSEAQEGEVVGPASRGQQGASQGSREPASSLQESGRGFLPSHQSNHTRRRALEK